MSDITTKLTTIAENQQRVYDAGKDKGYAEAEAVYEPQLEAKYQEGYEDGKAEGGNTEEAYQQGVTDGKQEQYDAFWDAIQICGNKTNYNYCFSGKYWTDKIFKPKYELLQTASYSYAFYQSAITTVYKHTFVCTYANYMFADSAITKVGTININNTSTTLTNLFYNCKKLTTVELLSLYPNNPNTNSITFSNAFYQCNSLAEIRFDGVIANNISFQQSYRLSTDSVNDIIEHLSKNTSSIKTLTLQSTVGSKLTDEQKAAITAKNWAVAY